MSLLDKIKGKRVPEQANIRPVVLLVLDGFGLAPDSPGNAITRAKTPHFDDYEKRYAFGKLLASGESAGLPAGDAGNSEVGHLILGAGQIIYQSLPRINRAIEDGSFGVNSAFLRASDHVKQHNSAMHLIGLVGSGFVHSSTQHLYALLDFCKARGLQRVYLHLFTDGRDAPPQDGLGVVQKIERRLGDLGVGEIATISGRYFGMDRDGRWERTQKVYEAMVAGVGERAARASEAVKASYAAGKTDEFVEPTVIIKNQESRIKNQGEKAKDSSHKGESVGLMQDDDAILFFNFRVDRPRQLTMAIVLDSFKELKKFSGGEETMTADEAKVPRLQGSGFERSRVLRNIFMVTMTEYQKGLPVSAVAFPPVSVTDTLPQTLSEHNLLQMHMAESEKERMVTIYFDGLRDTTFPGEEVVIVRSPKVATYDTKPEMSVFKLVDTFISELEKDKYHFFVLNFANADMVAHSGNLKASIKAVEALDRATGQLVEAVLARDGVVFITADHGNAEELLTYKKRSFFYTSEEGSINTEHSNNPVPLYVIGRQWDGRGVDLGTRQLSDVAPTILKIMNLPIPSGMTGKDLFAKMNKTIT